MARIGAWAAALAEGWSRRLARLGDRIAARRAGLGARPVALGAAPEPLALGEAEAVAALAAARSRAEAEAAAGGAERFAGFAWLDDAAAADRAARERLRGLAFDWIRRHGLGRGPGWTPELAGRRLARLASHADWLERGADRRDRDRLRRALSAHLRFLDGRWRRAASALGRLEAAAGLALGAAAATDRPMLRARAARSLGAAAEAAVRIDGGVESRNADELAEAFALLAWTHHALGAAGIEPDARHGVALHRAALALRALRLGDGGPPRLHGAGAATPDRLDAAFAMGGAAARGPRRDHAMGFLRLAAGRTVAILDAAPPSAASPVATASPLALEVSVGRRRLFGAVGPGGACGGDWAVATRATAAQSCVEVAGASCARLEPADRATAARGRRFATVPAVTHETAQDLDGAWVLAEHDGYLARFGLTVSRRLNLSPDGRTLRGEDALRCPDAAARKRFDAAAEAGGLPFLVRFHLHPGIAAEAAEDARSARLVTPEGAAFTLAAARGRVAVTGGVWIEPGRDRPTPAAQVVIAARAEAYWGRVSWSLTAERAPARAAPAAAEA